jgi:hypothetical protein
VSPVAMVVPVPVPVRVPTTMSSVVLPHASVLRVMLAPLFVAVRRGNANTGCQRYQSDDG